MDSEELEVSVLKVPELKAELAKHGLSQKGLKKELAERLQKAIAESKLQVTESQGEEPKTTIEQEEQNAAAENTADAEESKDDVHMVDLIGDMPDVKDAHLHRKPQNISSEEVATPDIQNEVGSKDAPDNKSDDSDPNSLKRKNDSTEVNEQIPSPSHKKLRLVDEQEVKSPSANDNSSLNGKQSIEQDAAETTINQVENSPINEATPAAKKDCNIKEIHSANATSDHNALNEVDEAKSKSIETLDKTDHFEQPESSLSSSSAHGNHSNSLAKPQKNITSITSPKEESSVKQPSTVSFKKAAERLHPKNSSQTENDLREKAKSEEKTRHDRHTLPLSVHPPARTLYITGFSRPIQAPDVQAMIEKYGALVSDSSGEAAFFMDGIKSHIYATFVDIASAETAASALHDTHYPVGSSKKLNVSFVDPAQSARLVKEEQEAWVNGRKKLELEITDFEGVYKFELKTFGTVAGGVPRIHIPGSAALPTAADIDAAAVAASSKQISSAVGENSSFNKMESIQDKGKAPGAAADELPTLPAKLQIDPKFSVTKARPVIYYCQAS